MNATIKRIAILCNGGSSADYDRKELVEDIHNKGIQPYTVGVFDGTINPYYREENSIFIPVLASRNNINPINELKSILSVKRQMFNHKIDSAVIYGVKNHPAMVIGCKLGKVKKILCVVNGSGNLFRVGGIKGRVLRLMSFPMLRIAYSIADYVCFQNEDDKNLFKNNRLITKKTNSFITGGSGVNLSEFPFVKLPEINRFLFLARITPSKGIIEYIEAAKIIKQKYPDTIFDVVGPIDDAIEDGIGDVIKKADKDGIIEYHGPTKDVPSWMGKCRFYVYPSYYPEGVPRCAMQALASGRPIITCNTPGCKEIVIDGLNGFLIAPRNFRQLSEKMEALINNPLEAQSMGHNSRKYAEKKFNVRTVNKEIMDKII